MRVADLKKRHMHDLQMVRKHLMDDISSFQIDTPLDWTIAEAIVKKKLYKG